MNMGDIFFHIFIYPSLIGIALSIVNLFIALAFDKEFRHNLFYTTLKNALFLGIRPGHPDIAFLLKAVVLFPLLENMLILQTIIILPPTQASWKIRYAIVFIVATWMHRDRGGISVLHGLFFAAMLVYAEKVYSDYGILFSYCSIYFFHSMGNLALNYLPMMIFKLLNVRDKSNC